MKRVRICALVIGLGLCSQASGQSGIITTVAGSGDVGSGNGAFSGDGGLATSAELNNPTGVALDASGNLFIADYFNSVVRKVSANGIITTVAGNGTRGFSGDGGPATSAGLNQPAGVAVDSFGDLFIADNLNNRIRKVSPGGVITTVAGNGTQGLSGDGGPATSAELTFPTGVAVDASGNLFIADGNDRIRKVSASGIITTVAGNGPFGFSGDGGPATSALLNFPEGVAVDVSGNLFIADTNNNRIRKVSPAGIISTVAGNGTPGFSGDGGPATSAELTFPTGVAVDASGNLFIADLKNNRIRKVSSSGIITTVAGNGSPGFSGDGGPAISAEMYQPAGVAVDASGNVFIADENNNRIREVSAAASTTGNPTSQTITFGALSNMTLGASPFMISATASSGLAVTFASMTASVCTVSGSTVTIVAVGTCSITASQAGNANYAAATPVTQSFTVNSPAGASGQGGIITTVAGNGTPGFSGDGGPATSAELNSPTGVAVDASGDVFIADETNNRIRKVLASGIITTVAGDGTSGFSSDGVPATSASLYNPIGVAVDASGNIFIADFFNYRIRKVSTSGIITTVAGSGTFGFSGDGGPATSASFRNIIGVAVDVSGNIFIADTDNNRIRKVSASGIITTVAGNGTQGFSGDGGPATSASFHTILGVGVDSSGNIFIVDADNNRIRKVSASGIITTVAGNGTFGFAGDGGPATSAELANPAAVAVDAAGNLFIADYNRIREVSSASGIITTVAGNERAGFSGDGGPATSAELSFPTGVAVDAAGNLFIADNNRIREVSASATGNPASQMITFGALSNVTLGVAPFTITATASSGLDVTFASTTTSVCTISGTTVTVVAVGTCSITASQAGNANYAAATPVTQSFTVNPAVGTSLQIQSLTLTPNSVAGGGIVVGSVALSAAAPSGGAVVALSSASSKATVPNTVTVPAGATSATFTVSVGTVSSIQSVTITASYGGTSAQASLILTVPPPTNSQCTNISGNWTGTESGSYTVTIVATTETDVFTNPVSGSGNVTITQTGCSIQYNPISGTGLIGSNLTPSQLASMTRTGTVSGNTLSVTGLVALVNTVAGSLAGYSITNISNNLMTATGQVVGNVITLKETGTFVASGTYPAGSFTVTITTSSTTTFSGTPLQITTLPKLPLLTVGTFYSQSLVASGGNPPYTWSLISGALPPGIQMSSTGVITGTPTTIGTATFTVRVTDAKASTATQTFILGEQLPITEYIIPTGGSEPRGITAGPDGALWFTEFSGAVGRITAAGVFTEYPIPTANSEPFGITTGPDGALWFTESSGAANKIGRITTAGVFTEYTIPTPSGGPFGITAGPDGALWFTEGAGKIGRITTTGTITEYPTPTANSGPNGITVGPDGALWFTEGLGGQIGRITTAGAFTEYPIPNALGRPFGVIMGPDRALWFTEEGFAGDPTITSKIGRITTTGSITEYPTPTANSAPVWITVGPDGALWFTESAANQIARITTAGAITEYPTPTAESGPTGITLGPDGALWFTEYLDRIGRASIPVAGAPPSITPGGVVPVDSTVNTIQPGEWVSIYGTNLANATVAWNENFPTSLGGTGVTIDGRPTYLSFVSPTQIILQAPNDTATGSVPVVVTTASGTATSTVTLAPVAPSFLLFDSQHVVGIILGSDGTYNIIGPTGNSLGYTTVAAKAGDKIELFAMGLGPTNPTVAAGQAFSGKAPTTNPVKLLIDNVSVTPASAELSSAGVYQINLTVPAGLGTGDVPLVATMGGVKTPSGVVISLQ